MIRYFSDGGIEEKGSFLQHPKSEYQDSSWPAPWDSYNSVPSTATASRIIVAYRWGYYAATGYIVVPVTISSVPGGGRTRLPKFKFSAKFPKGLHVILQIQIRKFENDCYIMWKIILTENPSRFNVEPLLK